MAVCKFCGQDVPRDELFKHLNTKHSAEMQKARALARAKKQERQGTDHREAVTINPVHAAILEFVGEKLQLPMTPALIYGYFCAKKMGFEGDVAQFLADVIDDFFQARRINYYEEVMKWGIGETIIQENLKMVPRESPSQSGTNAK